MADRTNIWLYGDNYLIHNPSTQIDNKWYFGDNTIFDEFYVSSNLFSEVVGLQETSVYDFCGVPVDSLFEAIGL